MNKLSYNYYPIDIDIKEINASELYDQYTYGEKYIKTIKFNKKCNLNDEMEENIFITKIIFHNPQKYELTIGGIIINNNIINDIIDIKLPLNIAIYHPIEIKASNYFDNTIDVEYIRYNNLPNDIHSTFVYLDDIFFKGKWMFLDKCLFKSYKRKQINLCYYIDEPIFAATNIDSDSLISRFKCNALLKESIELLNIWKIEYDINTENYKLTYVFDNCGDIIDNIKIPIINNLKSIEIESSTIDNKIYKKRINYIINDNVIVLNIPPFCVLSNNLKIILNISDNNIINKLECNFTNIILEYYFKKYFTMNVTILLEKYFSYLDIYYNNENNITNNDKKEEDNNIIYI